jgi:DNA-binding transcriptional LysR family regulator
MSVAQHGSMGKAATELAVSQPVVSKAIASIEHTLNVPLFDRTPRGAEPTQYGRALIKWGNAVFDDLRQGVKEIEHLSDPNGGELRLGCTEPMASGFIPAIVDRLTRRFPKATFHVTQADPATQMHHLQSRDIELAMGRVQEPVPEEDFNVEILFQEPVFVATAESNKLTRRRKVKLADLMNELWSLPPPGAIAHSVLKSAFQAAKLSIPRSTVVTYSLQLHYALMATGRYLGVIPGSMLHFSGKRYGLAVVPVDLSLRRGPAGIVTLKGRTLSPIAREFIQTARELAPPKKMV